MRRVAVFAVLCAVLAAAVAFFTVRGARGEGWDMLIVTASVAAALTGALLWWLAMERPQRFGSGRGAAIGALVGLLSHYPCWYVAILAQGASRRLLGDASASDLAGPLDALRGALAFTLWSWLLVGWVTAIVGGLAGAVYARRVRRRIHDDV